MGGFIEKRMEMRWVGVLIGVKGGVWCLEMGQGALHIVEQWCFTPPQADLELGQDVAAGRAGAL